MSSNYHVEMNPSDVGYQDRYVVQEILKVHSPLTFCTSMHVQASAGLCCCCLHQRLTRSMHVCAQCTAQDVSPHHESLHTRLLPVQDMAKSRPIDLKGQRSFKILILNEVDRLSREAQASLRRTMEKYSSACRLVLCCNNVSKVWLMISRSRCNM